MGGTGEGIGGGTGGGVQGGYGGGYFLPIIATCQNTNFFWAWPQYCRTIIWLSILHFCRSLSNPSLALGVQTMSTMCMPIMCS